MYFIVDGVGDEGGGVVRELVGSMFRGSVLGVRVKLR